MGMTTAAKATRTTTKTANCRRCHALLTNPRSVRDGITTHCRNQEARETAERNARREAAVTAAVNAVDTTAFKDAQKVIDKAIQLILDGAIIPTRFAGVYIANASDGVSTYLTDTVEDSCTCPAGSRIGRCNHKVAAAALEILANPTFALAA